MAKPKAVPDYEVRANQSTTLAPPEGLPDASHLMSWGGGPDPQASYLPGTEPAYQANPTVFPAGDGTLMQMEPGLAAAYARGVGEYRQFDNPEDAAAYAENGLIDHSPGSLANVSAYRKNIARLAMSDRGEIDSYIDEASDGDADLASWLRALAQHESKYDVSARAGDKPQSSRGLFQIKPKFAGDYGVKDVDDWQDQVRGVAAWAKRKKFDLSTEQGRNIAYLTYNQGSAGARKVLEAAAGQGELPESILAAMANQGAGRGMSGDHSEMAQQFIASQAKRFSRNYREANDEGFAGLRPGDGVKMVQRLRDERKYDPIRSMPDAGDTLVMPKTIPDYNPPDVLMGGAMYGNPEYTPPGWEPLKPSSGAKLDWSEYKGSKPAARPIDTSSLPESSGSKLDWSQYNSAKPGSGTSPASPAAMRAAAPAGRAIGALGRAGIAGAVGAAGYGLGTLADRAFGISDRISDYAMEKFHGRPTRSEQESMAAVDRALQERIEATTSEFMRPVEPHDASTAGPLRDTMSTLQGLADLGYDEDVMEYMTTSQEVK